MDEEKSGSITFDEFTEWWSTEKHLEASTSGTTKKQFMIKMVSTHLFAEVKVRVSAQVVHQTCLREMLTPPRVMQYRIEEKEALISHMEALGAQAQEPGGGLFSEENLLLRIRLLHRIDSVRDRLMWEPLDRNRLGETLPIE